jgi:hypothetical protein
LRCRFAIAKSLHQFHIFSMRVLVVQTCGIIAAVLLNSVGAGLASDLLPAPAMLATCSVRHRQLCTRCRLSGKKAGNTAW